MIPKLIHYCAFGSPPSSRLLDMCRRSWDRHCHEYEFVEWNDETFAQYQNQFFTEAIARRRFAFASDYARAFVLNKFGGVYLDTDVELRKPIDSFLHHGAFTGFECIGLPFTAVWGSNAGHPLSELVCNYYQHAEFSTTPNTAIVSRIIIKHFGIEPNRDRFQRGEHDLAVYPSSTFCVDLEEATAVHHFAGSWLDKSGNAMPYKEAMTISYHANRLADADGLKSPTLFATLRDRVGIFKFLCWFIYRSLRYYGGRLLRRLGLK